MDAADLAINCSLALKDVPPLERPARARALGYEAVEFWWPFGEDQSPGRREVRPFIESVQRAEVETVLLNFPGGGPSVGDRGLLCVPGREDDFRRAAEVAVSIGRELGVTRYNPMVGNTSSWGPGSEAFAIAVGNLVAVAPIVAEAGGTIVLEPLSGFPQAALKTFAQARELVLAARSAGAENVAILFDLYHAAVNDDEVLRGPFTDVEVVGHVQIADVPGRGWPGTGEAPLREWVQQLRDAGYDGRVGLECVGEPERAAVWAL